MSLQVIALEIVAFILALSFHEAAHAWAADKLGDPTARLQGRLTLNPIVHIDPFMTILFPALLIMFGSPVVFGAAKPVPVDTLNLRDPKRDHCWIAAAGPISNIVLGAISIVLLWGLQLGFPSLRMALRWQNAPVGGATASVLLPLAMLLYWLIIVNAVLALFNLIPLHPLDGSWILSAFLEGRAADAYASLRPYGFIILIGLLYLGLFRAVLMPVVRVLQVVAFL